MSHAFTHTANTVFVDRYADARSYTTLIPHPLSALVVFSPPPPSSRMPSFSSVNVFFRPEVQRLSCPQHVLVLRSAAAETCDDRVCECWGESGVKCAYKGSLAMWETPRNLYFHLVRWKHGADVMFKGTAKRGTRYASVWKMNQNHWKLFTWEC